MPPDETDEDRLEKLPGDENTPFGPAGDDKGHFQHPETDSNLDATGIYHDGVDAEAGIEEPNKNDAVIGYKEEHGDFTPETSQDDTV